MSKKIVVKIKANGMIEAEVSGAHGKNCLNYIKELETLLNAQAVSADPTDEYYLAERVEVNQTLVQKLINKLF